MASLSSHFFKFIPPGFKYNLSIPRSFSTKLNGRRCKNVILRRGCREWSVDISDGDVFGDGWRKFVKDNGVQEFDFIVFKHQGNMVFDFTVFDQSTCERQYPSLYDEMSVEEPLTESDTIDTHNRSKKLKKRKRNNCSSQNKDKIRLGDDRCFVTIMTPYCIKSSKLHVPIEFARSNGLITKRVHTQIVHKQVVIMDEAQRTWPAKLKISTTRQLRIHLTGWRKLIIKNQLTVGDACMFEIVKHGEVTIFNIYNLGKKPDENHIQMKKETNSTIKKATSSTTINGLKEEGDKPPIVNFSYHIQVKEETSSTIKNVATSTHNDHRYFISTLKRSSIIKSGLHLPTEFWKLNGLKIGDMILKDDKGRSWKVELKRTGLNGLYIAATGFRVFCDANGLNEGDDYTFKLIENENGKPPIANFSVNVESPPFGKEDRPHFIGEVKSYNIDKSILHLPSKFVTKNGLLNKEEMILKNVKDVRSWTVELKSSMKNYRYIGRGWKDFYVANGLKEGDLFKLELVSNGVKPIANFYVQKI